MSFAHDNLEAFINLLQNSPNLFAGQNLGSLADNLPEGIEEISEYLLACCEEMPEIDSSLKKVRRTLKQGALLSEERGPGGAFPDNKTKAEYEKNLRETLLNALRQSSSSQ